MLLLFECFLLRHIPSTILNRTLSDQCIDIYIKRAPKMLLITVSSKVRRSSSLKNCFEQEIYARQLHISQSRPPSDAFVKK